jgi:hypothetical protein
VLTYACPLHCGRCSYSRSRAASAAGSVRWRYRLRRLIRVDDADRHEVSLFQRAVHPVDMVSSSSSPPTLSSSACSRTNVTIRQNTRVRETSQLSVVLTDTEDSATVFRPIVAFRHAVTALSTHNAGRGGDGLERQSESQLHFVANPVHFSCLPFGLS